MRKWQCVTIHTIEVQELKCKTMKKILFPFELDNPLYKDAYIFGVKFARNINAELIVLNVFKVEVGDDITTDEYDYLKKQNWFKAYNEICKYNRYYLEEHAKPVQELNLRFHYRFVNGVLLDEVRSIARKESIDMTVLPLSDQKEFNKRQLRIIRDNVYENSRSSLLLIPFRTVYSPIQRIVYAIDFKLNAPSQYLDEVVKLAHAFEANVHFLHISSGNSAMKWERSEAFEMVQKIIEKNREFVSECLTGKNVVNLIDNYVDQVGADLLIVVRHQHYFLDTIFHDSVSDRISFESKIPVLIMREKTH